MASRAAGRTAIREVLDQLKELLSSQKLPRLSEADTKANFVERYVGALGYRGLADITREYYVKNSQEFIDYVLKSDDSLLLAIEAKALQHDLTDKMAAQLVQYCVIEGIEWCVLTNGRELRLYNQYLKGPLDAKLIFKLDLVAYNTDEEFDAIFDQLWLLSKESMTTPAGIRAWMEHQRLDKALRSMLLDAASAPVKHLQQALAAADIVVSAETVVQWFRAQLSSPMTPLLPQQIVPQAPTTTISPSPTQHKQLASPGRAYWVLPSGGRDNRAAEDFLHLWLGKSMWGMGKSTPHRKNLKAGDVACFYAARIGIVATAEIVGPADQLVSASESPEPLGPEPIYKVPLANVRWLPAPIPLDESLRGQLDAFQGRSMSAPWAWFIQSTSRISEHDFMLLTASEV